MGKEGILLSLNIITCGSFLETEETHENVGIRNFVFFAFFTPILFSQFDTLQKTEVEACANRDGQSVHIRNKFAVRIVPTLEPKVL